MRNRSTSALRLYLVALVVVSLLGGCSRDPNVRKRKYFESGQRYYGKGRHRDAAIPLHNAIQIAPTLAEGHDQPAHNIVMMQDGGPAFPERDAALEEDPAKTRALLE